MEINLKDNPVTTSIVVPQKPQRHLSGTLDSSLDSPAPPNKIDIQISGSEELLRLSIMEMGSVDSTVEITVENGWVVAKIWADGASLRDKPTNIVPLVTF